MFDRLRGRRAAQGAAAVALAPERVEQLAVRVQEAASSFVVAAVPVALLAAAAAWMSAAPGIGPAAALAGAVAVLAWGGLLARLGRRGWLPPPDE
jgi:hypothetical protein